MPGLRRLSSCLPFLLRFIFLARERGKRWWRVSPSFPTALPHSSHLPSELSLESLSLGTIARLYERHREWPPPAPTHGPRSPRRAHLVTLRRR
jgi:hypothetical protein